VPKVKHKPIKVQERVQIKRAKDIPKAALVWRTGLFGVPPDSVRCTREPNSKVATFGNPGSHSAIIHRTVRCSTGLLKGKCALRPFLSILVIECQHKWSCVNLCQMMDKVKINIKVWF
jgi:hypothetical protein